MKILDLTNIKIIKNLCQKYGLHPNRKNGQNFLIDKNILEKIVAAAELKPTDTVLEIGPGFGVLTQELVKHAGKVVAVEKDRRLAEHLIKTLKHKNIKTKFKIINDDILKISNFQPALPSGRFPIFNPAAAGQNSKFQIPNFKIVSNLPYQITSPVLWKFLHEEENKPEMMVLMVQKEVAERIVAKPGQMSLLAVLCQFYAECQIVSLVKCGNFWPMPEIDSAIVRLKIQDTRPPCFARRSGRARYKIQISSKFQIPNLKFFNEKEFFKFIKIGFSAKRKMLKNNLARGLKISQDKIVAILKKVGLDEKIRAQELRVEEWVELFLKTQDTRYKIQKNFKFQ